MASDSIDEQPVIEVAHSHLLVIGYLFDKGGGETVAHPHFHLSVEDISLGCFVAVGRSDEQHPGDALALLHHTARKTSLHHHEKFTVTPFAVHILKNRRQFIACHGVSFLIPTHGPRHTVSAPENEQVVVLSRFDYRGQFFVYLLYSTMTYDNQSLHFRIHCFPR